MPQQERSTADKRRDAFVALVDRDWHRLVARAGAFLDSPDDAEDAVHSASLAVARTLPYLKDTDDLGEWLLRGVFDECRSVLRQRRSEGDEAAEAPSAEEADAIAREEEERWAALDGGSGSSPIDEAGDILLAQIAELPDASRRVAEAVIVEGSPPTAAAAALEIPADEMWLRLHRVRRTVQPAVSHLFPKEAR